MFDITAAIAAQKKYCAENQLPHFAPQDGFCFRCRRNIYSQIRLRDGYESGITVEEAGSSLITGCPHCNYSYCE